MSLVGRKWHRHKRWLMAFALGLVILSVSLWRLADHDLDHRRSEPFVFSVDDVRMAGTLWLPDGPARAAVVIVHGDGPQDRTSSGGYAPFINSMLARGIAVASWDKPGIGSSEGDWLSQSMYDRSLETREALTALTGRMDKRPVGAVGFSQAGWVLPKLSASDADFIVLIGAAVSWSNQNLYFTRTRLRLSGMSESDIERALADMVKQDDALFAADAEYDPILAEDMSEARWSFVRRNRGENVRDDLRRMRVPVLALWGEDDLNVDPVVNSDIYRKNLAGANPANQIATIPNATHGLLKAHPYNAQLVDQWSWLTVFRFLCEGRYAYAPSVLDQIGEWILNQNGQR